MKHLRKFNESLDAKSDYILSVFADLQERCSEYLDRSDEEDLRYEIYDNNKLYVCISLPTPSKFGDDLDAYIKYQKEVIDIYEEAKVCINKVKIEFPEIEYHYETGDNELDKINKNVNYSYMYYFYLVFNLK